MLLRVTVKPNTRMDELVPQPDGSLLVKIKAPPVDGRANKYLAEYIAAWLGIAKTRVSVVKGTANTHKTLSIDMDEPSVAASIARLKA